MKRLRHPIRAIEEPFGKAGLIVAVIALVLATTGAAFAAAGLSGKQKKEVEKIAKKLAGKPGVNGAAGPAGPAGKDGASGSNGSNGAPGAPGKSVLTTAIPTSSNTCSKQGGTEFEVEESGQAEKVCNGTTGFTKHLPKGETETGAWTITAPAESRVNTAISFPIPLASDLDEEHAIFLAEGKEGTEHEEECPGSVEDPLAKEGYLCVYTSFENNVEAGFVVKPSDPTNSGRGAGTNGAVLRVVPLEIGEPTSGIGSWAVSAPGP